MCGKFKINYQITNQGSTIEQALVLGVLAFSFPRDLRDKLMSIPGLVDANFIY